MRGPPLDPNRTRNGPKRFFSSSIWKTRPFKLLADFKVTQNTDETVGCSLFSSFVLFLDFGNSFRYITFWFQSNAEGYTKDKLHSNLRESANLSYQNCSCLRKHWSLFGGRLFHPNRIPTKGSPLMWVIQVALSLINLGKNLAERGFLRWKQYHNPTWEGWPKPQPLEGGGRAKFWGFVNSRTCICKYGYLCIFIPPVGCQRVFGEKKQGVTQFAFSLMNIELYFYTQKRISRETGYFFWKKWRKGNFSGCPRPNRKLFRKMKKNL